jgi:aldose 1-epimerase
MLTLARGGVVIMAEHGGAVLGWRDGGTDLLRHAAPDAALAGDVRAAGCFPLLPYCNRIAQGRFRWADREYRLARNFGDHPHAIHGIGWQRCWMVERATPDAVTLLLRHDAMGPAAATWPFAFDATLDYATGERDLSVTLTLTNRHAGPAPAGLGLHPYFPRIPGATLQFAAQGVWENDATTLPVRHVAVPPAWDHRVARPVGAVRLDNAFTGWDGRARIGAGSASLDIAADPVFGTLQVFTPEGADFFCVEPVTHAPDALNRPDLPRDQAMAMLEPGETLRGGVRLTQV